MGTNQTELETSTHSLNLSSRYASKWGAWEVGRELISNAKDAVGDGYLLETPDPNTLRIWTDTEPQLAELFVMGQGTKDASGGTIGQFGEGLKLAALVCTRDGESITMRLPGYSVGFCFAEFMGSEVLHAVVQPIENDDFRGFGVTACMPGIVEACAGRFLPSTVQYGPITRTNPAHMNLYSRGVFITPIMEQCLWDWNLNVNVNRDRSMVTDFDLKWEVNRYLLEKATDEQLKALLQNPESWEAEVCGSWMVGPEFAQRLAAIFHETHGEKAVLQTDNYEDSAKAVEAGYSIKKVSRTIHAVLASVVKTASDVVRVKQPDFQTLDTEPFSEAIAELRRLDAFIAAPPVTVRVFENHVEQLMGFAALDDMAIWLNARLFTEGSTQELVRTYLHEVAHFTSGGPDCSRAFANSLDAIAGRLGMAVLDLTTPKN
jgi:hypothetical protein